MPAPGEIYFGAFEESPFGIDKDPADRLIVAVARLLQAPVVTIDRRILVYGRQGHAQVLAY